MPNFTERPTPVRRRLAYLGIFVVGIALGGLFGRHWGWNFILLAAVAFEAAWLIPQLKADGSIRFKPVRDWINSSNLFEWLVFAGWASFYVAAVAGSFRKGEPDLFHGLLLLLAFFSAMGLSEHVLRSGAKPPHAPPPPG